MTFAAFRRLVVVTWRERLLQPLFGGVCLVVSFSQIATARFSGELQDPVLLLTLLIAGGSIGRDVTSGVLPLLFTRPLVRSRYVFAKWVAVSTAAAIISTFTLVVEAAYLARAGQGLGGVEVAEAIVTSVTTAFGISSVLVLFSVLASGFADVLIWVGLNMLPLIAHKVISQRVAEEWHALLNPSLDWAATVGPPVSLFQLVSYLSTVTLCLGLAAIAINRKELSYASG